MKFLRKHAEGATEAAPEYWYGVIEGFGGTIWPTLFFSEHEAREAAATLEGTVVIIAARVLEDDEGEYWPLPVRTPEIELAEAEQDVEEARQIFADLIDRQPASDTPDPRDEVIAEMRETLAAYEDALDEAEAIFGCDYADHYGPLFELAWIARKRRAALSKGEASDT